MAADAFWSFCMAINVYLTLFRRYTPADLKKQEWKYLIFCYGTPFIPAFVFLFIKSDSRGKMYGPAVVRCQYLLQDFAVFRSVFHLYLFLLYSYGVILGMSGMSSELLPSMALSGW